MGTRTRLVFGAAVGVVTLVTVLLSIAPIGYGGVSPWMAADVALMTMLYGARRGMPSKRDA